MTTKDILGGESPVPIRSTLASLALTVSALFATLAVPVVASANAPISYIRNSADRFIDKIDERYGKSIDTAAMLTGVDRDLIVSVIAIESEGNPEATSPVGAKGLMQLMPETARGLGVKDRTDPFQNILGGTRYIKDLENNYGFDNTYQALIAYNMGPARARRFLSQYDETDHAYVKRVAIVHARIQARKKEESDKVAAAALVAAADKVIAMRPMAIGDILSAISLKPRVAEATTLN